MTSLANKHVLLIAPRFFGYDIEIHQELLRRGAIVDFLPDRPFDTPLMTAVTRLRPNWISLPAQQLYIRELERFGTKSYDYILVVNGQTVCTAMLMFLRKEFPDTRMLLYMWDSIENRRHTVEKLEHFDGTFTFDPHDARKLGMTLRPLFYAPGFEKRQQGHFKYQLSFIGTAHTDRYAVVDRLKHGLLPEFHCYWYLYLQAPWVYQYYRLTKPGFRHASQSEFNFAPLAKGTVHQVFADSLAVLDIEHPHQRGLTMRTFETLGSCKKLVTTNKEVLDYDFYRKENICVIDRKAPAVPREFLETPYLALEDALYRKYSIAGWLDEVMSIEQINILEAVENT
jgi:hypothetical protein